MAAANSDPENTSAGIVGILLAAGRGRRFDPSGMDNKLLQPLENGEPVVAASAKILLSVLPQVLAIVRPGAEELAALLRRMGCEVAECMTAEEGMAASLVHGLALAPDAAGWVIALGDMPYVQSSTIVALRDALDAGADIAIPVFQSRRGNPVAFSRRHLPSLMALRGDRGARDLLRAYPAVEVSTKDAGIHRDIDIASDICHRDATAQAKVQSR